LESYYNNYMATFYVDTKTGAQLSANQLVPGQNYVTSGTGAMYTAPQPTAAPTPSPYSPSGGAVVPAAQAPASPTPQPTTPTAPIPAPTTPTTTQPSTNPTRTPTTQTTQPTLTMPANGSVVDLLSMAGQDSSFAARQQLAQQYGIQGYSGTAAQNQDLSKKFIEAYNAKKGTAAPQSGAEASSALDTYFQDQPETQQDPTKMFMDAFGGMNPIEANLYQQLSQLLATPNNTQSLTDFYKQEVAAQGIPELNMELADINKIMDGTEDDIRAEVQNAGGFATESQVQALTGARNKNLLKQANYLSNVLQAKNDYVDRIVSLTQADRKQVSEDLDRKLGITNTLISMAQRMEDNAKENYMNIVQSVGWSGLAQSLKGNPAQTKQVERMLGLAPGELQSLADYKKPLTQEEELRNQNLQLQNLKLKQDLNTGPSISTQVVDVGGKKVLINSKTGAIISDISKNFTPEQGVQLASAQQTIVDTEGLIKNGSLASAVGPNPLARLSIASAFGGKSNFIAGVEQLRGQLTLQNLQNAKANGATFGALSDSELSLLSSSASKLGTWAIKDDAGNVVGYRTDEGSFKKELDRINNFSKLDFILKGGDPASVGVQRMADGTFWTKNSDGSFVKLQ
jgi:hypothetical protein